MAKQEEIKDDYDFSFMSDIDLALMQSELKKFPEDHSFRIAVLLELGKREKINAN